MRLTTTAPSEHHVTIPAHSPLKLGTLRAILGDIATAQGLELGELASRLFDG